MTPEPTLTPGLTTTIGYCFQDFSPCNCSVESNNKFVTCVSVETIRDVFQRVNEPDIYQMELSWSWPLPDDATNTISLPEDFMGNTSVTSAIYIYCTLYSDMPLVIHPLAFRSSQNSLNQFSFSSFYLALQEDFNFLNEFNRLETLEIYSITNLTAFQHLPPLPSLKRLLLQSFPDLNKIAFIIIWHIMGLAK